MSIKQIIDKNKLAELANGLITYERAEHNVDPRETLDGTTFRLESNEGYKYGVYKRSQKKLSKGGSYVDVVQSAIADGNLVSFYQKGYLDDLINEKGPDDLEHALELLYEGDDDQEAFKEIVDYIGGRFDIVGLIFFIKDCDNYLPIRSSIFDKKFSVLGIDSNLDGHCSWDKYQEYIGWIREIQQFLVSHINKDITLLDAHSFVWIVDGIQEYITEGVQLVEHKKKFGIGKIVGYEDEYVLVKFGKTVRKFDKKNAFEDGFLTLIPSDYSIYKDAEDKGEPKTVSHSGNRSYIVFQGGQYDEEYACGYLWAPYHDKKGSTPHHWARMKELKPGDRVFHYSAGCIRAISTVTKPWVDSKRPSVLSQDETWKRKGMKVECDPIILDDPIDLSKFTNEILKCRKVKYSGFNKNGSANEGYLFELEPELANLLLEEAGLGHKSPGEKNSDEFYSWEVKNDNVVVKACDKSFFDYRGSGVPRKICWFFEAESIDSGEKKDIVLKYKKKDYNAYLQRETSDLHRMRIFWHQDLANQFSKYNNPEEYPSLIFRKINDNTFTVFFDTEIKLTTKEVEVAQALLKLVADRKRRITYGALSDMTESKPSPHTEMADILDAINKHCDILGLPYVSAMVVNGDTKLPGPGFKDLCVNTFGYDESLDVKDIMEQELDKIGKCDSWSTLADDIGIEMPETEEDVSIPEEVIEKPDEPIIEGAKKQITVNKYERDPKAKKICKDYYMKRDGRITCQVCGFDFGKVYGPDYANIVEVHHIVPISEIGKEYVLDPIKDLIPVCPNCHTVIHANGGISIDNLKKLLKH